jgi:hypothetical protein
MRFSNDGTTAITGSNYITLVAEQTIFVNPQGTSTQAPTTEVTLMPNIDIGAGKYIDAEYDLQDINNSSRFPSLTGWTRGWKQGVGSSRHDVISHFETAGTFLGIQLLPSSGNIVSGEWMLMGIKN